MRSKKNDNRTMVRLTILGIAVALAVGIILFSATVFQAELRQALGSIQIAQALSYIPYVVIIILLAVVGALLRRGRAPQQITPESDEPTAIDITIADVGRIRRLVNTIGELRGALQLPPNPNDLLPGVTPIASLPSGPIEQSSASESLKDSRSPAEVASSTQGGDQTPTDEPVASVSKEVDELESQVQAESSDARRLQELNLFAVTVDQYLNHTLLQIQDIGKVGDPLRSVELTILAGLCVSQRFKETAALLVENTGPDQDIAAEYGLTNVEIESFNDWTGGMLSKIAEDPRLLYLPDLRDVQEPLNMSQEAIARLPALLSRYRSVLAVPVAMEGRAFGVLFVLYAQPASVGLWERRLVETAVSKIILTLLSFGTHPRRSQSET
jgi:GAF domain-containing protein